VSPFQLVAGVEVADLTGIHEGFSSRSTARGYHQLTVNVSAPRLVEAVVGLAGHVAEPGFLVLEVPCEESAEAALREDDGAPFHRDVYYLDGIDYARFAEMVRANAAILIEDGEVNFGFGSHDGYDEVFVGAYKIVSIYAEEPRKYIDALVAMRFGMEDQVRTIWDNISIEAPGRRRSLAVDGRTVRDLIAELRDEGLYLAEQRED
jgi:hypothetical protein